MKKAKQGIKKNLKINYSLFFCLLFPFCKGVDKIILPIRHGHVYENKSRLSQGTTLTIFPSNNYLVRAIEDSDVKGIYKVDESYSIFANGKYSASYGNLDTFFVQKNEKIKKGQIIGKIKADDNARLDFNLDKNGKSIISEVTFKRN
jgi:murein DD-endopeptidase MepM/ murein hydrolase activator NlpD